MINFTSYQADVTRNRRFDCEDVLSVLTEGKLAASASQVRNVVGYVTGDEKISDLGALLALPRAVKIICEQSEQLRKTQFPDLAKHKPEDGASVVQAWLAVQRGRLGKTISLSPAKVAIQITQEDESDFIAAMRNNKNPNPPKPPGAIHN